MQLKQAILAILAVLLIAPLFAGCQAAPASPTDVAVAPSGSSSEAVLSPAPAPTEAAAETTSSGAFDHADFSATLAKYVKDGQFDYAGLKANAEDMERFEAYLARMGKADASGFSKADHYAFWVNAYNAFNIKAVLDHWPIESPKSVEGYFDKLKFRVAGKEMTINDMEYVELIPNQNDGRAHFAVVCADNGSLALETEALTPANLDATLDKKTAEFVSNPENFRVDREKRIVYISQLFEWYDKDFTADPKFEGQKAVEYLVPYVDAETAEFLKTGDYAVEFIPWDWTVNDVAMNATAP